MKMIADSEKWNLMAALFHGVKIHTSGKMTSGRKVLETDLLIYVGAGTGKLSLQHGEVSVQRNSWYWVPFGKRFGLEISPDPRVEVYSVFFDLLVSDCFEKPGGSPLPAEVFRRIRAPFHGRVDPIRFCEARHQLMHLVDRFSGWRSFGSMEATGLLLGLLANVFERKCSGGKIEDSKQVLHRVERLLADRYCEGVSMAELEKFSGYHRGHLVRLFKKHYQVSPAQEKFPKVVDGGGRHPGGRFL